MNKEYLINYVNIIDKVRNNKIISKSEEEIRFIVERNIDYKGLAEQIRKCSREDGLALVEEAFKEKEVAKTEQEQIEEAIKKAYGVDMSNIEYIKLDDTLYLTFYDNKLGRKRLIEYNGAKSLATEFTNIQNNNELFQSDDYQKNAANIALAEAGKYQDRELGMVDIDTIKAEYHDKVKMIKDQDPRQIQRLNELIKVAESRNIKYVNLDKMIALDESGNIIETHYDEQTNQVALATPVTMVAPVEEVSNEDMTEYQGSTLDNQGNMDATQTDQSNMDVTPTEFEETDILKDPEFLGMVNESAEIYHMQCTREQFYANISKYAADMNKLEEDLASNKITQEEYECYSICCEKYLKMKKNSLAMKRNLTLEKGSEGSANILIISILVVIIGLIIAIVYVNLR